MFRQFLILAVLAVLPCGAANGEFVVDSFTTDVGTAFTSTDDFGTDYGITRSYSNLSNNGANPPFDDVFFTLTNANPTATITWTFNDDINFPGLGYYAENFRLEVDTLNSISGVDLLATPGTTSDVPGAPDGNWLAGAVTIASGNNYFDLTNLEHVTTLNDLDTLSLTFGISNPIVVGEQFSFAISGLSLVATPEPTSAASLGLVGLIGLACSSRRRKKSA